MTKQFFTARLGGLAAALALGMPLPTLAAEAPSAFSPEVSLILQGRYRQMKDIDERGITGFWPAAAHAHGEEGHSHGADKRGFSLDHSELVLAANIDNLFRGQANFAVEDEAVEVEEAWFSTLGLGHGFTLRGGRFFSGVGYLNEQHPHTWDFADAPLMYQAMFGAHGYRHDGVQLKWLAPAPFFLEFGAEVGRGDAFPGTDRNRNGAGAGSIFAHVGGDLGRSHAWRAGVSYLATRAAGREAEALDSAGEDVAALFDGKSRTLIADFVWKWVPDGNAKRTSFKLQGEYFSRRETGTLDCDEGAAAPCDVPQSGSYSRRQSGFYLQGAYQFMPQWRVGYRYDQLKSGTANADLLANGTLDAGSSLFSSYRPKRHSVMLDWSPSEFSRLRLQYANDRSMQGVTDKQVTLQYVFSLGAHGAHKF